MNVKSNILSATNPTKLWLWVHSGWGVLPDFSLLLTHSLPLPDSRSEKFTRVIGVIERHLKWQRRSLRGRGGGGGQVEMRNEMEPINSCHLVGCWIWPDARTASSQMRKVIFLWGTSKILNAVCPSWIWNKHVIKTCILVGYCKTQIWHQHWNPVCCLVLYNIAHRSGWRPKRS